MNKKCMICGSEHDEDLMRVIFTGRKQFVCPSCDELREKEIVKYRYDQTTKFYKLKRQHEKR